MNNKGREQAHDLDWFKQEQGITSTVHGGKMQGIRSISTSCKENSRCAKNKACKGSICEKCYSDTLQNIRATLREACLNNGRVLRSVLFDKKDLPILNECWFRIESWGDVDEGEGGLRQSRNYLRLAKRNPQTTFAWWTKNPDVVDEALKIEGRPRNIVFIVSSLFVNVIRDVSMFEWVDGVFTVFTKEYLEQHPEVKINCGKKPCLNCLRCYKRRKRNQKLFYTYEELK